MEFADELFNLQATSPNQIIQPFTRRTLANIFDDSTLVQLNKRQKNELLFYQLEFNKDLDPSQRPILNRSIRTLFSGLQRYKQPDLVYFHKDEVTLTINPIYGITTYYNKNGENGQRRMGAELRAQIGKIGIYGSLREVYEVNPLSKDSLATPKEGAIYKYAANGSGSYSETRGGITYGWKTGYVGIVRDYVKWGYGYYGSNIFDINTVPFAQIKLHVKPNDWFQFDYFHGALQSGVVDSLSIRSIDGLTTFDFYKKFIAANMLSFRPWKSLWISFGNSIIYSSSSPELTYLVPLMFYKSVDHYLGSRGNRAGGNGNSQMFGALSFRPFRGLHLYSTTFMDELSLTNMFDSERHTNWFSIKSGFRWSNILPNTTLTFEHIRTNAMVYKHFIPTTTFANAGYNLGHYLRDNAREFIMAVKFKPTYWLSMEGMYQFAEKAADIKDDRVTRDPETGIYLVQGIDYLANTQWIQSIYSFQVTAQPIYRLRFTARIDKVQRPKANASYQMPFYEGNSTTFSIGSHFGF